MTVRTITARTLDAGTVVILPNGEPRTVAAVDDAATHVYVDWVDGGTGIYALGDAVTVAADAPFVLTDLERACGVTMDDVMRERRRGYVTSNGEFIGGMYAGPALAGAAARLALGGPVEFSHLSSGCPVYRMAGAL